MIALQGLGSYERGLVGDLGLLKLCKALYGRWVEADETAALLEPYERVAGPGERLPAERVRRGLDPATGARRSLIRCCRRRAAASAA